MTTQDIAKAGVAVLPQIENELFHGRDEWPASKVQYWEAIIAALSLLEPVASGESVIVPAEPTEEMLNVAAMILHKEGEDFIADFDTGLRTIEWSELEQSDIDIYRYDAGLSYRAMIAAAGKPTSSE